METPIPYESKMPNYGGCYGLILKERNNFISIEKANIFWIKFRWHETQISIGLSEMTIDMIFIETQIQGQRKR